MAHQHTISAADGTSIAWSTTGSGDPVVLVHGITESAASWDPVTERLSVDHEVIALDLRGHGESGGAGTYGLEAMAGDVLAVVAAAGASGAHLVGHSLGGIVVTAAGAVAATVGLDVSSVVDVDQSLQLGAFKDQIVAAEAMLRDPDQYRIVVDAMFETMSGELLPPDEVARVNALRRAEHEVVLGVWELLLTEPAERIAATVDEALAEYRTHPLPYLAIFGIDPGEGYEDWLSQRIPSATVESWADHGHYPHLVDPERFVARLRRFWS